MKYIYVILFVGCVIALTTAQSCTGGIHRLDNSKYPTAKCLDGSSGAYYFSHATHPQVSGKWVIALEGGGECVTKTSCLSRSKGNLGSSIGYQNTTNHIMYHTCEESNPFSTWNKVYVKYCSGDLFYGMDTTSSDRAFGLQFSGYEIMKATFDDLFHNFGLDKSDTIILTGYSAGGIGAVNIGDALFDMVYTRLQGQTTSQQTTPRTVFLSPDGSPVTLYGPKVAIVPVAGYHFQTNPTYTDIPRQPEDPKPIGYIPWKFSDWEKYLILWNSIVPTRCQKAGMPAHQCLIAQGSYDTIVSPLFVVQSIIDSVVLPLHGALPPVWSAEGDEKQCYSDTEKCNERVWQYMSIWQQNITNYMAPIANKHLTALHKHPNLYPDEMIKSGIPRDGAFGSACLIHTEFKATAPTIDGMSYKTATYAWLNDNGVPAARNPHFHMDTCPWGELLCGKC